MTNLLKQAPGFFDLPHQFQCRDPEHNPPTHLFIPRGKGYRHVCPRCGAEQVLTNPERTIL